MKYIQPHTKDYQHASIALFISGFVTFATLYTTQPLMPVFAEEFGISAAAASVTLSISTGILAFSLLMAAALADGFGRKTIMTLSLFSTSILGLLTAFSPNFAALLVMRGLLGFFLAGVPAIAMTYVGEEFDPKGLGKMMGLYISGTSLGGMSGRLLTGLLTDLFGWREALGIIGAISVVLSYLFWHLLPRPRHSVKQQTNFKKTCGAYRAVLVNRRLMLLISLGFILMGSFVTMFNYIGFQLMAPPYRLSQTVIGLIFIVYLAGALSSVYMGKKADAFGSPLMIKIAIAIMGSGALITLFSWLPLKIAGIAVFTFGFFGAHSIASSWVGQKADDQRVQASSLYLLSYYLGSSLAGSFGGFFWIHFAWTGIIAFIAGLLLIAYPVIFFAEREKKQLSRECVEAKD
ncbi:MFS transporter [Bacillus sonorensis]|uniref:Permease n=2 Tax=Bacillus sonorensis TaxID=119858 RepID=M5PEZ8_9BACI|nr:MULTISPECIES: MFS transporter [Bacillus]TWK79071.1 Inner membrane transport protein YnfM [Bacillus paralicheniformis]ASB88157.1 putative MFS-type transporter YtbD [Bacillus sonorensis]EME75077.1 permease [Bacillus sonorensis L12]MBG9916026.1 MFS transporter [Bacillus sonorensis]MCF7617559.1 MFS transporter [Bacillus sonorensis]